MKWIIILVAAIDWSCDAVARAEDFRLRVETVERKSESATEAKDVVLNAIEVVTRPGEKFQTKVVVGAQTLVLSGKLERKDDGGLNVQIRHLSEFDTGEFVTFAEGGKQPIIDRSSVSTTLKVIEGKAITLSEFVSAKSKPDECPIKSERRVMLVISKDEETSRDRTTN
jgi:hypothetical protein